MKLKTDKNQLLLITLICSFFGSMIISYPLWINDRLFPVLPIFEFTVTNGWIHTSVICLLFISGIFSVFRTSLAKHSLFAFLIILLLLCIQDMNRWQPWVYIYFILLSLICLSKYSIISDKRTLQLFQIAFIGIYFWSGMHKFNAGFAENVLPQLFPFAIDVGLFAYFIPLIETCLALGLVFRKTRRVSVFLIAVMHIIIVITALFGPWFYDLVIIPWNIGMAVILFIIFRDRNDSSYFKDFSVSKALIVCIFLVLPATNFIGFWDSYPSFSLFSGKTTRAYLYVSDSFKANFQPSTLKRVDELNRIYIQKYAYSELNVPFYPEEENYLHLFKIHCEKVENDLSLVLEIESIPELFSNTWESKSFFCDEINQPQQ